MFETSQLPLRYSLIVVSSVLVALSVAWLMSQILRMAQRNVDLNCETWDFEKTRQTSLYNDHALYRWFAPLIDEIKHCSLLDLLADSKKIDLSLRRGGSDLPWTTREFMGVTFIESLLVSLFIGAAIWLASGLGVAICAGLATLVIVFRFRVNELNQQSAQRMCQFRHRLPFAIDLMALMIKAGGEKRQCLTTVVEENQGHPIGVEFGRVEHDVQCGTSLLDALARLQMRLQDDSLSEIVFSIRSADELGTPLGQVFLDLASQMRLRRAQNAEKLVGEATAMLPLANLIIMAAGLLVVVAPYVIRMFIDAPF